MQPGPADGATLTMAGGWQGVTLRVTLRIRRLETVNLYQILLCDVVGDQECRHILALITLQLNDLSQLCVLHDCAVAAKLCAPISMARSAM